MLSLEQIRRLENRVYKAVELLKALKEDNNILKSELTSANERVEELEQIISDYRNNQLEIEQGIIKAIQQLDDIESFDDDSSLVNDESPALSVAVSTETVQEDSPIEIKEESSISVINNISSNSNTEETTEIADETDSESVHNENSQQLDIF